MPSVLFVVVVVLAVCVCFCLSVCVCVCVSACVHARVGAVCLFSFTYSHPARRLKIVSRLVDGNDAILTIAVGDRQRFVFAGTADGRLLVFGSKGLNVDSQARIPLAIRPGLAERRSSSIAL